LLRDGLLGDAAVQLRPAVGVDVVGGADGLAEGVAEPAFGGDGDRPGEHGVSRQQATTVVFTA
jgi:hypothetical protein